MEEEIKKIQAELLELEKEARSQRERIIVLYQQLQQLTGKSLHQFPPRQKVEERISFENFIGLKVIHFIGIIVLVIGFSIGVKYAIDRELISEVARIMLAYLAGIALYLLSVRFYSKYLLFSAILLSGGAATVYFTTYAAFVYYNMMPFAFAFLVMVALTAFIVYKALVYNREEIAILGMVGAYAIPFLISKNYDNALLFFLYVGLINLGIVFLGMKRPWMLTGKLAQHITWILFIGWSTFMLSAKQNGTALFFICFFFLLFLFQNISEKLIAGKPLSTARIYQLVFNTLTVYIVAILVWGGEWKETDVAFITLYISVLAAVQSVLFYYYLQEERAKSFMVSLSFLLFMAFIAFQWDGLTVTFLWLLLAIVIFILGLIRKWRMVRISSIVLFGTILFKLVVFDSLTFTSVQKVIAYISLGILLLVVSYFYQRYRKLLFQEEEEGI